ncbi:MAG: ABC transporter ATP-binding protein [Ruminococcaceae bacterium]|nr:ABC transporter ATP-binding protein [Oscillospiraceae bacterium]
MKLIMKYVRPHFAGIVIGLIIKFAATILELFLPFLLEKIIDDVVPTGNIRMVIILGVMMVVCSLFAFIFNVTANRMAATTSGKATRKIRYDLFSKITYLSSKKCDEFTESSLISRLTSDTYNVNQFMNRIQRMGVRAPILLIGGIILTMMMDVTLSLVLAAMLPLVCIVVIVVTKVGVPIYTTVQEKLDILVKTVQENITGIRVIKALSKTEYEKKRFNSVNEQLASTERKASDVMAISNPMTTLILNIGLVAVVVVGAYRVNAGQTEPGTIIAFLSYFTIMLNAMLGITRIFVMSTKGMASAQRIEEVLEAENDMKVLPKAGLLADTNSKYHIEFRDVSFSYNGREDNISGLSFGLMKGQTLGIIGSTGSGKSTIINLLMRFYDVTGGNIRISGEDIRTIPEARLHTMFGAAFQSDFLFADTVRENIAFGREISDEDIIKASKSAQSFDFISELDEGYDHMLTIKGSNLSGGQKQRLLISRALAGNPDILILDDSSSALDYKTDAQLRKALSENYGEITSVIIAQRVSSVKNADLILVLDDGAVIGKGTHDELMEDCAAYRRIADLQMGAHREEVQA